MEKNNENTFDLTCPYCRRPNPFFIRAAFDGRPSPPVPGEGAVVGCSSCGEVSRLKSGTLEKLTMSDVIELKQRDPKRFAAMMAQSATLKRHLKKNN